MLPLYPGIPCKAAPPRNIASALAVITAANQHFRYIQLQEEYIKDEQRFALPLSPLGQPAASYMQTESLTCPRFIL
jgi:hypothetical protein